MVLRVLAVEEDALLLSDLTTAVFFDGDAGGCDSGSEKIRAPGDGCESHEGVCPMTLGIAFEQIGFL